MKKLLLLLSLTFITVNAQHLRPDGWKIPENLLRLRLTNTDMQTARPASTVHFQEDFNAGIPSTWTVTDNAGTGAVWTHANDYGGNTLDGTPFVIADSDAAGNVNMDTYLESPVINVTGSPSVVYLTYDMYFQHYSSGLYEKGDVEVYDGTNWVVVRSYHGGDFGSWSNPLSEIVDVTSYINPSFKVRFHYYDANYEWFWAVDNVKIVSPDATDNDLSVVWGIPKAMPVNEEVHFSTIVKNEDLNTQDDFDVSVEVLDNAFNSLYSDTVSITGANLAVGQYYKVNFPNTWTAPATGDYQLTYKVMLPGDNNPANDTIMLPLKIRNFSYQADKVYSYIAYDGDASGDLNDFGTFDTATGNFTTIDSINGLLGLYYMGGDFVPFNYPALFAVDNFNTGYFINGNAVAYEVGFFPFLTDVITGVAFSDNGPSYYSTVRSLYLFTPYMDVIKIGDYNVSNPFILGIALDNSGNLYGIDAQTDKLYLINTSDATLTAVGDLGYNIEYIQDIGMDRENNILYATLLYDDGSGNYFGGLFVIDTNTGQATPVGTPGSDEYSICAYAPGSVLHTELFDNEQWTVYPNPAENILYMQWKTLPDRWEIFDLSGRRIGVNTSVQNSEILDITGWSSGTYIIKAYKDGHVAIRKFIKR